MDELFKLKQEAIRHQQNLSKEKDRLKSKPNEKMDEDIPEKMESFDFWCDECQEDFSAPARKTTYRLEGFKISTIRGECPECGEIAIRYATHRDQDPYYNKSRKIRRQRNQYMTEFLTAEEFGFKTLYGEPYENFLWDQINDEKRIIREEREIGLKGQSLKMKEKLAKIHARK